MDVYQNGVLLKPVTDYAATTGTSVVLTTGATTDDVVEMIVYDTFAVADTVSAKDGGTFSGNMAMSGTLDVTGAITSSAGATITTADNNAQLTLKSTDADASAGPLLNLSRDNSSAADNDIVGQVQFNADDDGNNQTTYGRIHTVIEDASNGSEDGLMQIHTNVAGTLRDRIKLSSTEVVINEEGIDSDFRVESDGNANMINVDAGNNLVGIGMVPDTTALTVNGQIGTTNGTEGAPTHSFYSDVNTGMFRPSGDHLGFSTGGTERLRIDNGGNVLVNQTSTSSPGFSNTTTGLCFSDSGRVFSSASGAASSFNRNTSDGDIIVFAKDGTTRGSIRTEASVLQIGTSDTGIDFETSNNAIRPVNISTGALRDNAITLGRPDGRFTIVYATTSTINTSDQNEKQQIASLTSAEITAAKAISKLFKTFKWNDAVAAKGDAARTHTGVIAQEVQQAMTDAGLDATKYAFWCSDTWWETSTEVAAVEADEEAGVEAKDAYTRIDTYQTADEAPEGATQRTRLGIRYAELMSFVLASIEDRLTALENA
jgi:hypothetical protein